MNTFDNFDLLYPCSFLPYSHRRSHANIVLGQIQDLHFPAHVQVFLLHTLQLNTMMTVLFTLFLLLLVCPWECQLSEKPIRCEAPSVNEGQQATITCFFHVDVVKEREEIVLHHYSIDGKSKEILFCSWRIPDKPECDVDSRYKYHRPENTTLTLTMANATQEYEGRYDCQIIPSDPSRTEPCNFTLLRGGTSPKSEENAEKDTTEKSPESRDNHRGGTSPKSEENAGKGDNTWIWITVGCSALIVIIVVIVIFICCRRGARFQGKEKSSAECDSPLSEPPVIDENPGTAPHGEGTEAEKPKSPVGVDPCATRKKEGSSVQGSTKQQTLKDVYEKQAEDLHANDSSYEHAMKIVQKKGAVTIVEPERSEKSALGQRLVTHFEAQGYSTLEVINPIRWAQSDHTNRVVIINEKIDDLKRQETSWSRAIESMRDASCPVIVIIRSTVTEGLKSCLPSFMQSIPVVYAEQTKVAQQGKGHTASVLEKHAQDEEDQVKMNVHARKVCYGKDSSPHEIQPLMRNTTREANETHYKPRTLPNKEHQPTPYSVSDVEPERRPLLSDKMGNVTDVSSKSSIPRISADLNTVKNTVMLNANDLSGARANVDTADANHKTLLHRDSQRYSAKAVDKFPEEGANIETTGSSNLTPLHLACQAGETGYVRKLLATCTNIDVQDSAGQTPLHLGAQAGKKEVVELLFGRHASANKKDKNGLTPLHLACQAGNTEIVEVLLTKGALANKGDFAGQTPLHIASQAENTEVVELLLKHGAKADELDDQFRTPLHLACQAGNREVVRIFIAKGAEADKKDFGGQTLLHIACRAEKTEIVKFLLSEGANVEAKDDTGQTPLHKACQTGSRGIVKLLLDASSQTGNKDNKGMTPIHFACRESVLHVVRMLIDNGADLKAEDNNGQTPLHIACQAKNKESMQIVKELLKRGANKEAKDNAGQTPLHIACQSENKEIVQIVQELLLNGADIKVKDNAGQTPLDVAHKSSKHEVVQVLTSHVGAIMTIR